MIWLKEGTQVVNRGNTPLMATHIFSEESLRNRFGTVKQSKKRSYVSQKEFENLRIEVKRIRSIVEEIQAIENTKEIDIAVCDAISQLKQIKAIKEIHNNSKGKELFFIVESENFSENLLRKIANVEINLARKYSDFLVLLRPTITENKKPLSEGR
jgi:CRISPR/Cas system CSM-associated protein Csm4 (group 5 of RAMP superfamily)